MMRLWPAAKTWTMRPASMVFANQSAAFSVAACCDLTCSTRAAHLVRYCSVGVIALQIGISLIPPKAIPHDRGGSTSDDGHITVMIRASTLAEPSAARKASKLG